MIPFMKKPWARPNDWTWDIEATNLLNEETIDYEASPYRLLPTYSTHCVVFQNHVSGEIIAFHDGDKYEFDGRGYSETIEGAVYTLAEGYEPVEYTHRQMSELKGFIQETTFNRLVAHNQISYDLLAMKAVYGFDYSIGDEIRDGGLTTWSKDTWAGKPLSIFDTLVVSKTLNPDRYGGHSLDKLAAGGTSEKFKFRKEIHVSQRFKHFAADMLYYCIFDVKANTEVYNMLIETYGLDSIHEFQKWASALKLEHAVAELITRQEHRGFWFNMKKAEEALTKLDAMMEERRVKVEPLLPPRPATKKFMGDYTPPAKQFKQNGELSSHMEKFIAKHEGVLDGRTLYVFGHKYDLPLEAGVPLKTTMPAEIGNTTHIKNWLVSLGWHPNEYKEKDLTVDDKKIKLDPEKLLIKINRYIDETFDSAFKTHRLEHLEGLGVTPKSGKDFVRRQMLKRAERQGLKVLSNPSFTVGADKEMCPDLERITEQFPFTKDIVEYLTFKHRRNSILGGGQDWEDPDEEPEKGYMAGVRPDGRIATPADTCGAATSRFKHRKVANVPRVTSLFGKELRELFGVAVGYFQIGYDFDSLEARVESAYCYMYDAEGKAYCKSLMLEKPFDVHTMMAQAISKIIGTDFGRSPAKNVKYGATYGAQAAKIAKTIGCSLEIGQMIFDAFWDTAFPLKTLKDALQKQWEANGKKYIIGIDGRRVPTRSAHAILNSLFQSGGVICAKRAMVLHDRKLKAEGLSVDFFLDDWKSKTFCQQMIAYHDEAQLEASASLFKFKTFPYSSVAFADGNFDEKAADKILKKQAQDYKDEVFASTGEVWSDISHNDRGFYVAYCRAGVLATDAVREAGQFYAAPEGIDAAVAPVLLDLTAGYIVEKSWAGCH